jgi:hypothetical protein
MKDEEDSCEHTIRHPTEIIAMFFLSFMKLTTSSHVIDLGIIVRVKELALGEGIMTPIYWYI